MSHWLITEAHLDKGRRKEDYSSAANAGLLWKSRQKLIYAGDLYFEF